MPEIEFVGLEESAFRHAQVPYCIHQVSFSLAVAARDAVDVRRESQFLECDIPEILYYCFL